ncbi:hypothetical protein [Dactylosporangium roseum]|uniref:hypothetical protein n=1 Tax=Dactylosporangium roseum TaxID=47989 RepID=UPI0021B41904|nr:hypothetical protein [Dactylosporangium roseum]
MVNPWFESVAEAQRRARKRLPKSVYSALVAGSERGVTLEDNQAAFAELGFAPYTAGAAGLIATLDWSFSMGRDWGSPHLPERITPVLGGAR